MSFHVQVGRGFRSARAFNLDAAALQAEIVGPWSEGRTIELGDREWDPSEHRIEVLEGPALEPAELALGQGWNNARRVGRDVTAEKLARSPAAAAVALLADDPAAAADMQALLTDLGIAPAGWDAAQARILASAGRGDPRARPAPGVAAAVLAAGPRRPSEAFWLALGLALGTLGGAAIVVRIGEPEDSLPLRGLPVVQLGAGSPGGAQALAERLRLAGCALRPSPGWDERERFADR